MLGLGLNVLVSVKGQNSYPSSEKNYSIYLSLFEISANSDQWMRFICQKSSAKRTR